MKIGLVATHAGPIPPVLKTGDIVIWDLCVALSNLGHTVSLFAPPGSRTPPDGKLYPMRSSNGNAYPSSRECEMSCLMDHHQALLAQDIVHDFSITKAIAESLHELKRPVVTTALGGSWPLNAKPPPSLCVWSEAMRERWLRGATDYEDSPTPEAGGEPGQPIKDAHVVFGGVDTDFYCPDDYSKGDAFLYLNRWHPVKGYREAIELAIATGVKLVVAGEDPFYMRWDSEIANAHEAQRLAKGHDNISIMHLPPEDADHHKAKRELYRRAKALLYPVGFQEPFGLSMVEAMACGTPVLGLARGSVPELVTSDVGAVFDPDVGFDHDWIRAYDQTGGYRAISERCRNRAVALFSRRAMAARYLREYEAAIRGESW